MPFLAESEIDKQRRLQNAGQSGQTVAGPSGVITSGTQSGPAPKGPTKSGSYTNLQSYLSANKEQASDMANRVVGNIENQGSQAKSAVDSIQSGFKSKVDESVVRPNDNLINEAASNPTEFIKDQDRVQQFTKMRDAQYKGPVNLVDEAGFADAQKKAQNVQSRLKATETEAGRFGLVQEQFGKPTYTRGQQRLDQLLLQNDPTAKQKFADVRNQLSGLDEYLNRAATTASSYAQQAKQDTENARQMVENRFLGTQGLVPQFKNDLDYRAQKIQEDAGARAQMAESIIKGIIGGVPTTKLGTEDDSAAVYRNALSDLGVNQDQVNTLLAKQKELKDSYGAEFDPMEFLQRVSSPSDITRDTVASADEYARYQALRQLLGLEDQYFMDSTRLGTATPDTVDYKYEDALNAVTGRLTQAEADKRAAEQAEQERRNREASPSSGDIWDSVEHVGDTITGGIADTTNMVTQPIARTGNWLKKRFSDERLKTDVKKTNFSDIEKYLKGKY